MRLIILAAGKSNRIYSKIKKHKCLIKVNGISLIDKIINDSKEIKIINQIDIVVGFKKKILKQKLYKHNVNFIDNKDYSKKDMLYSLKAGLENVNEDLLISYSDIFYSKKIFRKILKFNNGKISIPILKNWKNIWKIRNKSPFDDCETLLYNKNFDLIEIGKKIENPKKIMGQYMGLIFIPKTKIKLILNKIKLNRDPKMHITSFLNSLIMKNQKIRCIPFKDYWYEFDDIEDIKNFRKTFNQN